MNRTPLFFIGGAVILGVIALALLLAFTPSLRLSPPRDTQEADVVEYDGALAPQTEGVLKGGETYTLPGTTYYQNVTPPVRRNVQQPTQNGAPSTGAICTQEAMLCPDGSYVGRTGPNCSFAPCSGQ